MKQERGHRRIATGVVTSDKMGKTIIVESVRLAPHPRFGKHIRRVTRYCAHDENGQARVGDKVRLIECRRVSKTKAWRLLEVIEPAPRNE
jgi:small subunit ribosomal protein S17